jgi:glycosyltransferase involved in cell wall biosynthesis
MARSITTAGCGRVVSPEDPDAFSRAVRDAFGQRADLPAEGRQGRAVVEAEYSRPAIAQKYDDLIRESRSALAGGRSAHAT